MKMWTYVFSRRKGAMFFLVCLYIFHTMTLVESLSNEATNYLDALLTSQNTRNNVNSNISPVKRGWEAWDMPWMKASGRPTKRAWEGIGLISRRVMYPGTLEQLKRGWEGLNWRYRMHQGKRSQNILEPVSEEANSCVCCKNDNDPLCCLSCTSETKSEQNEDSIQQTENSAQGYTSFLNVFCRCCSSSDDAECCRYCDMLTN
ncbi:unnamed protein product [Mytilus edulis]|uniref:Uncharacterized protein n=1 Tax=Mytilus edulis TaxID=6550 RepID=A0A8S3TDQ8_MYTED|nr:unnamed protein product [Mytilus edulis]